MTKRIKDKYENIGTFIQDFLFSAQISTSSILVHPSMLSHSVICVCVNTKLGQLVHVWKPRTETETFFFFSGYKWIN